MNKFFLESSSNYSFTTLLSTRKRSGVDLLKQNPIVLLLILIFKRHSLKDLHKIFTFNLKLSSLSKDILILFSHTHIHTYIHTYINIWDKTYFRPYIFTQFPFWSLTFFFTAFSPCPEKRVSFLSLPLHQRQKLHRWQTAKLSSLK